MQKSSQQRNSWLLLLWGIILHRCSRY